MKRKQLLRFAFISYCTLMLWLLFIRYRGIEVTNYWNQVSGRINLLPFTSTLSMLQTLWNNQRLDVLWVVVYNLGGNIIMFVPLGFFLPALWDRFRKFGKCMAAVTIIMTTVELTQLLTLRGFCEIDDVLLNLLGAAIGFGLCKKLER